MGLTAVAFALPMAIFVAAISMVLALDKMGAEKEKELRLAVHHKTTLVNPLPEAHRRRIEGLDPDRARLLAVCGMRWFGGRVPDTQNTITSLGADPDTFPLVYSDTQMQPDEIENWQKDRQACVVGTNAADLYDWDVGERITLESTVPPYLSLDFHIVKVIENPSQSNYFWFRRDFLVESLKSQGIEDSTCNIFWVKCKSAAALRQLQKEIDAFFANTPEETKSEDENAFGANFTQAAGDIPGLMQAMSIVVVVVIVLVAGNTMMMSFRERTRELAVFKAIGFQSGRIFRMVLAESVILALGGSLIGVLPVALYLYMSPLKLTRMGPLGVLEVSWIAVAISLGIAVLVGLIAGSWPAVQALRLRTTDALRRAA